jgi:hypothetical protein
VGQRCQSERDCRDGVCAGGRCAAPTCDDSVQNHDETGVDCGGPCRPCTKT